MLKKRQEKQSKNQASKEDEALEAVQKAFFREVEEDLQREQLKKLWEKHGTLIVLVVIAGLSFAAGFEGWKAWRQEIRQRDSLAYESAKILVEQEKYDEAIDALEYVKENARTGYSVIADMERASILIESGKKEEGIAAMEAIHNNKSVDKAFRDLAAIKVAGYIIDDGDKDKILELIEPLIAPNSSWRAIALELKALLLLREGDKKQALDYFNSIINDTGATQRVRARAVEMVSVLEQDKE